MGLWRLLFGGKGSSNKSERKPIGDALAPPAAHCSGATERGEKSIDPLTLPLASIPQEVVLQGLICRTAAWILHQKEGKASPSAGDLLRRDERIEIGERAYSVYPSGFRVKAHSDRERLEETNRLMADAAVETIFEAMFHVDGYIARADILRRRGSGWHLIQVTSDVNDKSGLRDELIYTAMVMRRSGVQVCRASLWLISQDYRLGMENSALFVEGDHTAEVQAKLDDFIAAWRDIDTVIKQPKMLRPTLSFDCKGCDFFYTDCLGTGLEHPIFELPHLGLDKFNELAGRGTTRIGDIPDDFELTHNQDRVRRAVQTGKGIVESSLKSDLESVIWPAYYLDFETVMTAIPLYPNVAPYTQLPTQYSIHVCLAPDKDPEHRPFMADPAKDCRKKLAEKLVADLGDEGSIIVYHAAFEKSVISQLIDECPKLANALKRLLARIVDLHAFILRGYYHPAFHGSSSLKRILPVMVPGMGYQGMGIADGDTAAAKFARIAKGQVKPEDAERIINELRAYCERDTLAMVHLHRQLIATAASAQTDTLVPKGEPSSPPANRTGMQLCSRCNRWYPAYYVHRSRCYDCYEAVPDRPREG